MMDAACGTGLGGELPKMPWPREGEAMPGRSGQARVDSGGAVCDGPAFWLAATNLQPMRTQCGSELSLAVEPCRFLLCRIDAGVGVR